MLTWGISGSDKKMSSHSAPRKEDPTESGHAVISFFLKNSFFYGAQICCCKH